MRVCVCVCVCVLAMYLAPLCLAVPRRSSLRGVSAAAGVADERCH